ncbi:atlastin-1-like [Dermacentor andersoni]|uniref:atlastin-1-like n=1 Tax=Dermacentor andersoni TaxID=34620 RepID=UPI002415E111|nr:atlastin-1-like [Dermacentor andersoni]XP_054933664.1 atlastin-1-like [Dermacentor andersoni]XP_054933665.1 atlastin-1-like [Dermacentor andersoni]
MGQPVQIVSVDQNHIIQLHKEKLEKILLDPKVKDKAVAVVSINGAARKGKSFLMNFLIRYLCRGKESNWMGDNDTRLEGFDWSTSMNPMTKGIFLWDEAFLVPTSDGNEMAVFLMDTQGAFDSESTADETASLFALSILTSSLQIYNVSESIQEDDLQHLQFAAEYGKTTQKDANPKPFQRLVFLVRGWKFPDDQPYGADGGSHVVEEVMAIKKEQHHELQSLRQSLYSSFSSIEGFLLPDPGKKSLRKTFDGSLCQLDEEFKEMLGVFAPWLLAPEKLHTKRISGQKITCQELMNYFKVYTDVFKSPGRFSAKTLLEATTREINRSAKEKAKEFYKTELGKETYESIDVLKRNHTRLLKKAMAQFNRTVKFGDKETSREYSISLEKEINDTFDKIYKQQMQREQQEKELADLTEQLKHAKDKVKIKNLIVSIASVLLPTMVSAFLPAEIVGPLLIMTLTNIITEQHGTTDHGLDTAELTDLIREVLEKMKSGFGKSKNEEPMAPESK